MGSIFTLIVEVALLVMKIIGVSAQKRKNLLDWARKKVEQSDGSIKMKDSWEKIYKDLSEQIDKKNE